MKRRTKIIIVFLGFLGFIIYIGINNKVVSSRYNKVLVYNSDPDETYSNNENIKEYTKKLNKILLTQGVNSNYLDNNKTINKTETFKYSSELIKENIKDYKNYILIDIHNNNSNVNNLKSNRSIKIMLAENAPNFENNKELSELLLRELTKISSNYKITCSIERIKSAEDYFNQELSNKSILVKLGSSYSTNNDIDNCNNALSTAIKNIVNEGEK